MAGWLDNDQAQPAPPPVQPVGFLVDEINQFQIPITATTVIGSNPILDPEAAAGYAGMITIDEPGLAGVQVRVCIVGAEVTAEDVVGGGASWVAPPGQPPAPLGSMARTLTDGDVLHVGSQRYTYRAPGGPAPS